MRIAPRYSMFFCSSNPTIFYRGTKAVLARGHSFPGEGQVHGEYVCVRLGLNTFSTALVYRPLTDGARVIAPIK